ncbi:MAG: DinB family protein [Phycisphaeraceae bacterium]|nr:DinB family protein [Phycisphaeraceae bacterium]
MAQFPRVLTEAVAGASPAEARRRPESGAWSILEIVSHLADEETDDFRARLERTLRDPHETWPGIDPEGWARQRRYNEGDLSDSLARFTRERESSVRWLRAIEVVGVDWSRTHRHPRLGEIRAGDLLASWAAHDWLHLRQIAKRQFELSQADAAGFEAGYAGAWGA